MKNILKNLMKPLVICGPSGVGKGTLIGMLIDEYPDYFGFSVSHTTRPSRDGEKHGKEYFFVKRDEFELGIEKNEFIEYANVHNKFYGTSVLAVENVMKKNKVCILDIDVQGVKQVFEHPKYEPCILFIYPPSIEELEKRLRERKSDSEEQILTRMKNAKTEIEFSKTHQEMIDKKIVNDDLETAYDEFKLTIQGVFFDQ